MQFSIDPAGEWSLRKARKVLEIIEPEGEAVGVVFKLVDISTHARNNWVLIIPYCKKHDKPIYHRDFNACALCLGVYSILSASGWWDNTGSFPDIRWEP